MIGEYGNNPLIKRYLKEYTDGELIERYLNVPDENAFIALFVRHWRFILKRFEYMCRNHHDAEDLTLQLWTRVVKNLDSYQDCGQFPRFLMRSASHLFTDYLRRKIVKDRVINAAPADLMNNYDIVENTADQGPGVVEKMSSREEIDYLTYKLIPALPCEQRLVFLFKHESEYWEDRQRISWQDLGVLNGITAQEAWEKFEQVRNGSLSQMNGGQVDNTCSCESKLIYLVWTQAQRPLKNREFTWQYLSKILNVPENTLKTRYRAALKNLKQGLIDFNNTHEGS